MSGKPKTAIHAPWGDVEVLSGPVTINSGTINARSFYWVQQQGRNLDKPLTVEAHLLTFPSEVEYWFNHYSPGTSSSPYASLKESREIVGNGFTHRTRHWKDADGWHCEVCK